MISKLYLCCLVAPHAGAWIETVNGIGGSLLAGSHPMRVRGLKRSFRVEQLDLSKSHPMRVRGLKLMVCNLNYSLIPVAPHAGAWIETHRYLR